jgi:hypothetical protein
VKKPATFPKCLSFDFLVFPVCLCHAFSAYTSEVRDYPMDQSEPGLLLSMARKGNAQAMGQLFELYRQYLKLLAQIEINGPLRAKIDPSDVVQETFLEAHRDFNKFRGMSERELMAWLRQILGSSTLYSISAEHEHDSALSDTVGDERPQNRLTAGPGGDPSRRGNEDKRRDGRAVVPLAAQSPFLPVERAGG